MGSRKKAPRTSAAAARRILLTPVRTKNTLETGNARNAGKDSRNQSCVRFGLLLFYGLIPISAARRPHASA